MKQRMMKTVKIAMIVMAVLALSMLGWVVASAAEMDLPQNTVTIETEKEHIYQFTPEGYQIDDREVVPHTGAYLICGEAGLDVTFASENGESVTYDVILHSWNAVANEWCALIGLEKGVTLNITVYGENTIMGYNHPGIKLNSPETEGDNPKVNITFSRNSSLTVGSQYEEEIIGCVADGVELTLGEGAQSSLDISSENWREENVIEFFKGTEKSHTQQYTYVNDTVCRRSCSDCDILTKDLNHKRTSATFGWNDENYDTKHSDSCEMCRHIFGVFDHTLRYDLGERTHDAWCTECAYEKGGVEHTIDGNECTVCKAHYMASFTDGDGTTKYMLHDSLAAGVRGKSGTVKLLRNIEHDFNREICVESGELIIDLAGFELNNVSLLVASGAKASVIDTSEDKTGKWTGEAWCYSSVSGELTVEGIVMRRNVATMLAGGVLKMKDVTVESLGTIIVRDSSNVELKNVVYQGELLLNTNSLYVGGVTIISGSFGKIKVESNLYETIGVNRLLADGYAYCGENGILNGIGSEISGVRSIVEHSEHIINDKMNYNASYHWAGCACGFRPDTAVDEAHTADENGVCPACKAKMHVKVNDGTEDRFFADADAAFEYVCGVYNSTVTLLSDSNMTQEHLLSGEVFLDLNGYTVSTYHRIYLDGSLMIADTSVEQTGCFKVEDRATYIIEIWDSGSLTVEGGEISGIIYTSLAGGEFAWIEINGGKWTSEEIFRITSGTTLIINRGWFENVNNIIDFWASTGISVEIKGGTFVNSRLIYESSDVILSAELLLATDTGCELIFADERGNELQLDNAAVRYEGIMMVAHKGATLTSNEKGHVLSCSACGEQTALIAHHSFKYAVSTEDSAKHAVICGGCDNLIRTEAHSGGAATCQAKARCENCNVEYGELAQHTADAAWQITETHHYHLCIYATEGSACQEKIEYAEHADNDGNGKCDVCEHRMSTSSDEFNAPNHSDKDGLSAGGVVGIVIGSVTVAGLGGFSLFWFVIKKKKWSDLTGIFKK